MNLFFGDPKTCQRMHEGPLGQYKQVNESMSCSKVQCCEGADHSQSTMPSYGHTVSFVHQQKGGLEFGRKGYRFPLACVERCQIRIDG